MHYMRIKGAYRPNAQQKLSSLAHGKVPCSEQLCSALLYAEGGQSGKALQLNRDATHFPIDY
jgi:hypothetical protein